MYSILIFIVGTLLLKTKMCYINCWHNGNSRLSRQSKQSTKHYLYYLYLDNLDIRYCKDFFFVVNWFWEPKLWKKTLISNLLFLIISTSQRPCIRKKEDMNMIVSFLKEKKSKLFCLVIRKLTVIVVITGKCHSEK